MAFTKMAFSPEEGLRKTDVYPVTPGTEDEAREQIQGRMDELRDYINNALLKELANEDTGKSGAENIGSACFSNMLDGSGNPITKLWKQIEWLLNRVLGIEQGTFENAITMDMLSDGAVVTQKIADGAVTAEKMASGLLSSITLRDNAVSANMIMNGAVQTAKLAGEAVTNEKIYAGAVTDSKLAINAVTELKIADNAVTAAKLAQNSVQTAMIKDGNVTDAKLATPKVSKSGDTMTGSLSLFYLLLSTIDPEIFFAHSNQSNGSGGTTNDYVWYDESEGQWKLQVYGCSSVYLLPAVFGTASSISGTYPKGTVYFQYQE